MSLPALSLEKITLQFGSTLAADRLSLQVEWGECLALLGPTGAGKSGLLRSIAGLETPAHGCIAIGGTRIDGLPPYRRRVGMVFPSPVLLPRRTVFTNVALAIRSLGLEHREAVTWVEEILCLVELGGLGAKLPRHLTLEEQQRVALARALVSRPALLLLDDPFSACNPPQRTQFHALLRLLRERLGITTILATHSTEEVLATATRVALIDRGRILQLGPAEDLLVQPTVPFVSDMTGGPNLLPCTICGEDEGYLLGLLPNGMPVMLAGHPDGWAYDPQAMIVIQPQTMRITVIPPEYDDPINCLRGWVRKVLPLGAGACYHVALDAGQTVRVMMARHEPEIDQIEPGQMVFVTWLPAQARTVHAATLTE